MAFPPGAAAIPASTPFGLVMVIPFVMVQWAKAGAVDRRDLTVSHHGVVCVLESLAGGTECARIAVAAIRSDDPLGLQRTKM